MFIYITFHAFIHFSKRKLESMFPPSSAKGEQIFMIFFLEVFVLLISIHSVFRSVFKTMVVYLFTTTFVKKFRSFLVELIFFFFYFYYYNYYVHTIYKYILHLECLRIYNVLAQLT